MSLPLPLACSVRGCYAPLVRRDAAFVCANGHSFDIARAGYLNLLQPQDRRSLDAGDSREAVEARAALLAGGIGRTSLETFASTAAALSLRGDPPVVVDLGSGSGETVGLIAEAREICGIGIDLSTAAAIHAARRFPGVTWVVANADRRLPLLDDSVSLALSLHARRNPPECRRVLVDDGFLLVAVPAPDDLIELRELVQGLAVEKDRLAGLVAEHDEWFTVESRQRVQERQRLDAVALRNLLRGTYRGGRLSQSPRIEQLEQLDVTLASDVVLFAPRPRPQSSNR